MGLRSGKKRSSTLFRSLFVLSSDRALFSRDRTRNTTDEIFFFFFCRIESDGRGLSSSSSSRRRSKASSRLKKEGEIIIMSHRSVVKIHFKDSPFSPFFSLKFGRDLTRKSASLFRRPSSPLLLSRSKQILLKKREESKKKKKLINFKKDRFALALSLFRTKKKL